MDKIARMKERATLVRKKVLASLGFLKDGAIIERHEVCNSSIVTVGQLWSRMSSVF